MKQHRSIKKSMDLLAEAYSSIHNENVYGDQSETQGSSTEGQQNIDTEEDAEGPGQSFQITFNDISGAKHTTQGSIMEDENASEAISHVLTKAFESLPHDLEDIAQITINF